MTTLVKTVCQNCFAPKLPGASNFCCQNCFDEWMAKLISKAITQSVYGEAGLGISAKEVQKRFI